MLCPCMGANYKIRTVDVSQRKCLPQVVSARKCASSVLHAMNSPNGCVQRAGHQQKDGLTLTHAALHQQRPQTTCTRAEPSWQHSRAKSKGIAPLRHDTHAWLGWKCAEACLRTSPPAPNASPAPHLLKCHRAAAGFVLAKRSLGSSKSCRCTNGYKT